MNNMMMPMQQKMPQMQQMQGDMSQQPQQGSPNYVMQEDHTDEREKAFGKAFSDQAYNIFSAKNPSMVSQIVTFKVIKSSIDNGDAIGAFILTSGGETLYVPVIMAANKFKPLELFYSKRLDKFLPFTKDWINLILSSSTQELGEGVKVPDTLEGDKDITNLMRPPLYGRAVYAMDFSGINHLDLIKEASEETKKAFRGILKSNPSYLKFAVEHFGETEVLSAVRASAQLEKEASVPVKLEVVDTEDPAMKVKEVFGHKAPEAMKDMAVNGFAYVDARPKLNKATSSTDFQIRLEEPSKSGVYQLYDSDGGIFKALVIVNPEAFNGYNFGVEPYEDYDKHNTYTYGDHKPHCPGKKVDYMVIKENGDFFYTRKLIGTASNKEELGGGLKEIVFGNKKQNNFLKNNICFVKVEGDIISGTKGLYVDQSEVGPDGYKKYIKKSPLGLRPDSIYETKKSDSENNDAEIIHSVTPTGKLLRPGNSRITVVPKTYKIVKLGDEITSPSHLSCAREVLEYVQRRMSDTGGRTVKLASLGAGEYSIDGQPAGTLKEASYKLATTFDIAMKTSVTEFKKLSHTGDSSSMFITPFDKEASIFDSGIPGTQMTPEMVQQMQGQGQGQGQGQMPMSMAMPPMGGGSPQPNTSLMDVGLQTQDPELYNVGALNSLVQYQDIKELLSAYSPVLEKALDSSGRMLLTFWIKGQKAMQDLGDEAYFGLEESLRTVFRELGQLLVKLNQRAAATSEHADMM